MLVTMCVYFPQKTTDHLLPPTSNPIILFYNKQSAESRPYRPNKKQLPYQATREANEREEEVAPLLEAYFMPSSDEEINFMGKSLWPL